MKSCHRDPNKEIDVVKIGRNRAGGANLPVAVDASPSPTTLRALPPRIDLSATPETGFLNRFSCPTRNRVS